MSIYSVEEVGARERAKNPAAFSAFTNSEIGKRAIARNPELQRKVDQPDKKQGVLSRAAGFVGDVAKAVVKPIASAAIQAPRSFVAGAAGLAGNTDVEARFSKPINVPLLGEVKGVSANPDDVQRYGTQTAGETLGQAAEMGSSLVGAGGVSQVAKGGLRAGVFQAAKTGAKQGFKSGALSGFGTEIAKEDATLGSVAGGTVTGGVTGAAVGAVAAPVVGKLGKASQQKAAEKAEKETLDIVREKVTPKVAEAAQKEARISPAGIFKKEAVLPSRTDKRIAQAAQGLVKKGEQPAANITRLKGEIARISEKEVRPHLQANNTPFNMATLNAKLRSIEMPSLFKTDPSMQKTYDLVRQRAIETVAKGKKHMVGLYDARIEFDDIVEREFPRLYDSEKDTVIKKAIQDMRRGMNDFIADNVPDGATAFKGKLQKQSLLFEAVDNIADKARTGFSATGKGQSGLQRFGNKHPAIKQMGKYAIGSAVGTGVLGGGYAGVKAIID